MVKQIKGVLLMVFSALSGFFMPIQVLMLAILILFGVNFISWWFEYSLYERLPRDVAL